MADQPANPNPAAPPAAASPAPAAPPPAAAAPAPAPAAPARAPVPPKKPETRSQGDDPGGKKALKRIRQLAEKKAAELVQEKFPGMSLDEAAELVSKAAAKIDGAGGAPAGAAPAPGSDREKELLRKRVAKLTARAEKQKRKVVATKSRARDQVVELELKMDALRAGIRDEHSDFALEQYRKAVRNAKDAESIQDPLPFFQGMRASSPFLFAAAGAEPPVVTLRPTSAPPPSLQPGGETPIPATPGQKVPQPDAFQMNDEQWKRHKGSYGFRG